MNPRTLLPAALLGFALLLTACEFTISPGTPAPEPDVAFDAESTTAPVANAVTVQGNASLLIEVNVENVDDDALYVRVGTQSNVGLVLYTRSGGVVASSTRSDLFVEGAAAVASTASTALRPEGIGVAELCEELCIVNDADNSSYLVEVFNDSSSQRTFDLFLYTKSYEDLNEPANDTQAGAVALGDSFDSGAIEDIGDQDYWAIEQSGDLFFDDDADRPAELQLRLRLIDDSGVEIGTFTPGPDPIQVLDGDTAIVFESGGDAAALAGYSQYFLDIQP